MSNRPRDRDEAGHPRSARPRDGLGRPLPYGSAGSPRIPDDLRLTPADTLTLAQRLLDDGMPFHAHEVLEAAWKNGPTAERDLWQGLAQVAVGLTHWRRGNPRGAHALLERAIVRLAPYREAPPHDIDVDGVLAAARGMTALIEAGTAAAESAAPAVRLTTSEH